MKKIYTESSDMMLKIENIVKKLIEKKLTIATMESCTGGGVANAITNVEGASEIIKFSAVTYSNEYKIKMGVPESIIDMYSVYSIQTAHEMSKSIASFAHADIGIGITGKLNRFDPNNDYGKDNVVYVSIYYQNTYHDITLEVTKETRQKNKDYVISKIVDTLEDVI